jgi:hypothetical protein
VKTFTLLFLSVSLSAQQIDWNTQVRNKPSLITALTGDVTASGPSGGGSASSTLATVNSGPGTCGDASHVCQIVTNGKGLTTSQTQISITSGITALTSDVLAGPGSGSQVATLATVNSGFGSCGDSSHICVVTTDAKGRVLSQTAVAISAPGTGTVTNTMGVLTAGQLVIGEGSGDVFVGDLSGDVTTSGSTATSIAMGAVTTSKIANNAVGAMQLANNAVSSTQLAVVNTRRTCQFDNDTQSATALTAAQITGRCDVPYAATLVEVDVYASTGTSSLMLQRLRPNGGATANLLSAQLPTGSSGAYACALTGTAGTCISGITSSATITISNTALAAGDTVQISAATITGSPTWYHATAVFTVN